MLREESIQIETTNLENNSPPLGPPPLEGARVKLRPMIDSDIPRLHKICIQSEVAWRWRFSGAFPSLEAFAATLSGGSIAQFTIVGATSDRVLGYISAYNADLRNRTVYFAVAIDESVIGTGFGVEATILFVNYLFTTWEFHKVYFEAVSFALDKYKSILNKLFAIEAVLKEHYYYAGSRWDMITCAIYRTTAVNHPIVDRVVASANRKSKSNELRMREGYLAGKKIVSGNRYSGTIAAKASVRMNGNSPLRPIGVPGSEAVRNIISEGDSLK